MQFSKEVDRAISDVPNAFSRLTVHSSGATSNAFHFANASSIEEFFLPQANLQQANRILESHNRYLASPPDPRIMQQMNHAIVSHELIVEPSRDPSFDMILTTITRCGSIVTY